MNWSGRRSSLAKGEDPQQIIESLSNGLTNKFLHMPSYALNHAAADERDDLVDADQPAVPSPPSRMNKSIAAKLTQLSVRLEELNRLLSSESITANLDNYRKLTREHAEIAPVVELYDAYLQSERDIHTAQEMSGDAEMREFADAEIRDAKEKLMRFGAELQKQLLPKDPNDERNIFLEIRAGTGGDESALFAGDLFRMYARFAERQRWQVEIISQSPSEAGGYKEIIAKIVGHGRVLQAQVRIGRPSGSARTHDRDPGTHSYFRLHRCGDARGGRDHGRGAESGRVDGSIPYRASGAGGQHINKTDSAVRITHLPTGIVVECQDGRSQHKNKAQAMSVLAARIRDKQTQEQQSKQAATRKSLVGSGDRSGRIRTYNFPQGRITDHRINLTLYKIEQIMDGDLNELCSALMSEHQAEQLAAMGGVESNVACLASIIYLRE